MLVLENCLLRNKPDCCSPEICSGLLSLLGCILRCPAALVLPPCTPSLTYVCVCQHPHHGKQIPRGHSCGTDGPSQCFASDHDNNDNRLFMTPRLTKSLGRLHRRIGVHIHHIHKRTPSPWRGNVHFQSISGFLPPPPPNQTRLMFCVRVLRII